MRHAYFFVDINYTCLCIVSTVRGTQKWCVQGAQRSETRARVETLSISRDKNAYNSPCKQPANSSRDGHRGTVGFLKICGSLEKMYMNPALKTSNEISATRHAWPCTRQVLRALVAGHVVAKKCGHDGCSCSSQFSFSSLSGSHRHTCTPAQSTHKLIEFIQTYSHIN